VSNLSRPPRGGARVGGGVPSLPSKTPGVALPSACWGPCVWDVLLKVLDGVNEEALKVRPDPMEGMVGWNFFFLLHVSL